MSVAATRVLLVDDEVGFTRLLRLNLEREGEFEVREVNDSRRAVSMAREFKPDILLLDIMMPELDGGDVAAALEKDPTLTDIPVIYVTAIVKKTETDHNGVYETNGDTFVGKPVKTKDLISCIRWRLQQDYNRHRAEGGAPAVNGLA